MAKATHRWGTRPDPWELGAIGVLLASGLGLLASAPLREAARGAGFLLLEIVGHVVDRPTSLVVAAYALLVLAAAAIELRGARPLRRELLPTAWVLCGLALLGQAYLVVLAVKLRPGWLLGGLILAAAAAWRLRRPPREGPSPRAPILALFVLLHVLVEGAAGHILTPWLHGISDAAAATSRVPVLRHLLPLGAVAGPAALLGWALRRGLQPIAWPHPDPRRAVDLLALPSLTALAVVGLHYATTMWGCSHLEVEGLRLVSTASGAFDLEVSADGSTLLASRREDRELLWIDLASGREQRLSTARSNDTAFDRTEPETLLARPDGRFLVLLASSDSEQGNGLAVFDPSTGTLGPRLEAAGVSDVVDDGQGGVWISTEFAGRLLRIDPATGRTLQRIDVGWAETNKVLVDGASGSAWSVGLWTDPRLRRIDLQRGQQIASTGLGTHQWDMALSSPHRLLFVPRLVSGRVEVLDAETLEARGALEAGFGVRPVETSPDGLMVVTGNLYTGGVVGHSVVTGEQRFARRVGGHLKALEIGPNGRIFAGGDCGIFEVLGP